MLRPRIIPCLLVHRRGLVKTVNFQKPKYVGDPINAVKIFNEKEVDELILLDIDATVDDHQPDYTMIHDIAVECRMPLCYGGGVKTVEQAQRIIRLGVEKVAISSAALENPSIVSDIARFVGSQSVVVVLDVKKNKNGRYEIWTHNGKKNTGKDPVEFAKQLQQLGVGEVTINSIDHDGLMNGYDQELISMIRNVISVPMTVLGGAGSLNDLQQVIEKFGIIGVSAGSLFVFKGVYKAVLINYPSHAERKLLMHKTVL